MKKLFYITVLFVMVIVSCKPEKNITFVSFGDKISAENSITEKEMAKRFEKLNIGDTINVKFAGKIKSVCQKKGCWIKVPIGNDKESFVKFKDYGFFLPMNSAGSKVILNGKAFKREISVKQLQHYAKDAGKSDEEIAKITKPKTTYSFLADGVLVEVKSDEK